MRHDLFYISDISTEAQRTACLLSENFPQILVKFETKHFAAGLSQMPAISFSKQ
jgi:hypothetical protein